MQFILLYSKFIFKFNLSLGLIINCFFANRYSKFISTSIKEFLKTKIFTQR